MVFARVRDWVKRNGTTIVVGVGLVGATYLGGSYILSKLQEARQRAGEDRIAKENLRRRFQQNQEDCTYTVLALLPTVRDEIVSALPVEQITEQLQQERQERLQRLGASDAPSSEFPSAPASVAEDDSKSLGSFQSSSYIHASQVGQSTPDLGLSRPRRSKAQLWQDMKIHSIARAMTLIYSLCLLALLTRIQLNLLGRRTYLSSVVALAAPPAPAQSSTISLENKDDDNYDNVYGNDFETNRKYLTFSWWLLHRGSKQIMERVVAAVKEVFSSVNIREDISLDRMSALIMDVRRRVEGATEEERRSMKWLTYVLPAQEDEAFVIRQSTMSDSDESPSLEEPSTVDLMSSVKTSPEEALINLSLRRLLDETADLVESPTFSHVLNRLLDAAFSHLVDVHVASEAFTLPRPYPGSLAESEPRITEVTDTKCKLAHILPVFCRQAHTIAMGSDELGTIAGVAAQEALGNEYLAAVDRVSDLEAFAAVIYSSNFEYEVMESGSSGAPSEAVGPSPATQPMTDLSMTEIPPTGATAQMTGEPPHEVINDTLGESEVLVQIDDAQLGAEDPFALEPTGESEILVLKEEEPRPIEDPPAAPPSFEAAWKGATSGQDTQDAPTPVPETSQPEEASLRHDGDDTSASEAIAMH